MAKKPSMGRQKIKIQKIEVKNHLQVTFSKRRSGLFKKASELCTLCGVEIGIIVFSPAGKVFSFGHPNVESIINRFLTRNPVANAHDPFQLVEAQRNASVRELNLQLGHMLNEMEAERKRGESLDVMRKANQSHYWWESPVSKLGLEQLEQVRDAMEELKKNVNQQAAANSVFMVNRVFEQYEAKPMPSHGSNINNIAAAAAAANCSFGYCHGFF
ncbi:hypothetical protein SASPL_115415 [Salvia splendens]|uniref:MADS-box domain-containing protein n=1 Tax=Salvia splendens TaxID=180675 RepID=A0A8X9A198_SALSN|nr:agamous-like MADS-box protein AGL61 [Salvia splendens]KAG6424992.1 hypothetical protein SASPL_115415 [Salvia splendens]